MSYDDYEYESHASSGDIVSIPDSDIEKWNKSPGLYQEKLYYDHMVYLLIDEIWRKTGTRFVVKCEFFPRRVVSMFSGTLIGIQDYTLYKHVEGTTYRRILFYDSKAGLYGIPQTADANTVMMYLNGFLNGFLAGSTLKTPAAGVNRDELYCY